MMNKIKTIKLSPNKLSMALALTLGINQCAYAQFPNPMQLANLNGDNGFVINGDNTGDRFGSSVSSAGDINGDGIDDLVIGANYSDPINNSSYAGSTYVIFGSSTGLANPLGITSLNGSNGFVLYGSAESRSGGSVSSAGDINGDGIDDLIIGARLAILNVNLAPGSSYVVFGSTSGFASSLNLIDLDGSNGFIINGENSLDYSGVSVSAAGDINGDGIDDLIIGAFQANPNGNFNSGSSYVVFGSTSSFTSTMNLSSLNGANGFAIHGENADDQSGISVSSTGDINGDGIDDLIIGANTADSNGLSDTGSSYVVFGHSSGFVSPLNLSSLNGSNGFVIHGENAADRFGRSVSSAGDVNGDGIDDLMVGAIFTDPNGNGSAGSTYVVFGSTSGFSSPLNLTSLDGSNGFVIQGENLFDLSGVSVSSAGDVNGDGIDDLIIGAVYSDPNGTIDAGNSYVIFGNSSGFPNPLNLSSVNGSNGFVLQGVSDNDNSGISVSGAGDINNDGIDDVIIGATGTNPNDISNVGSSYVVYGQEKPIFKDSFED